MASSFTVSKDDWQTLQTSNVGKDTTNFFANDYVTVVANDCASGNAYIANGRTPFVYVVHQDSDKVKIFKLTCDEAKTYASDSSMLAKQRPVAIVDKTAHTISWRRDHSIANCYLEKDVPMSATFQAEDKDILSKVFDVMRYLVRADNQLYKACPLNVNIGALKPYISGASSTVSTSTSSSAGAKAQPASASVTKAK